MRSALSLVIIQGLAVIATTGPADPPQHLDLKEERQACNDVCKTLYGEIVPKIHCYLRCSSIYGTSVGPPLNFDLEVIQAYSDTCETLCRPHAPRFDCDSRCWTSNGTVVPRLLAATRVPTSCHPVATKQMSRLASTRAT